MSANEFGREGHFQIVRGDADQPWFARWCKNYREVWRTSETYTRRAGVMNAIKTLPGGAAWLESYTPLDVDEREKS